MDYQYSVTGLSLQFLGMQMAMSLRHRRRYLQDHTQEWMPCHRDETAQTNLFESDDSDVASVLMSVRCENESHPCPRREEKMGFVTQIHSRNGRC